jgi:toxin CcdB
MAQFAVHRNPNRATRSTIPLLLDIQNNLLEELGTRVVIPLYKPAAVEGGVIEKLTPRLEINGAIYVAVTSELAGVSRKALGAPVADLGHRRDEIVAALDFLVTGI